MSAPLPPTFTREHTAEEVVAGLDLTGEVALVTGGAAGLGLEITRALAGAGARVIATGRDLTRAEAALSSTTSADALALDLGDPSSIERCARAILASGTGLDMVVANAGVMAVPERRLGQGLESQLAINHLGHFALVGRLWPLLRASGSRVVVVGSGVSRIRWEDMQFALEYDKWSAYLQSKTANRLFALWLDGLGAGDGVRAFSVAPGYIMTGLQRHLAREEMVAAGWIDASGAVTSPEFKTVEQGASTAVWAATAPELNGFGGLHCEDNAVVADLRETLDQDEARVLARISARLTGVEFDPAP
jgi:NAD(P)-dependent dehydrogenase (short-subunit alcohol dehydrogenase family)